MEQAQTKNVILDADAVKRKTRRIALEIAEENTNEKEIVIAGIVGNGVVLARALAKELKQILDANIQLAEVKLNKKDPREVTLNPALDSKGKVVILVDDVANTGKTMFYALQPFFGAYPKKIQTVVLVERSHKLFPVQTDYAGITLATTLQEHISVETEGEGIVGAWLY